MFDDIGQTVDFMMKHGLTIKQFFLLYVLYLDKEEFRGRKIPTSGSAIANIYKYSTKCEPWSFTDIDYLVEQGWLVDRNKHVDGVRSTFPDLMVVTEKFGSLVFDEMKNFDQLWTEYPSFVANFQDPRMSRIPLKATDRDELERTYQKIIPTKKKHEKVMTWLRWAKQKNLINMSIKNYVSSRMWEQHEQESHLMETPLVARSINQ